MDSKGNGEDSKGNLSEHHKEDSKGNLSEHHKEDSKGNGEDSKGNLSEHHKEDSKGNGEDSKGNLSEHHKGDSKGNGEGSKGNLSEHHKEGSRGNLSQHHKEGSKGNLSQHHKEGSRGNLSDHHKEHYKGNLWDYRREAHKEAHKEDPKVDHRGNSEEEQDSLWEHHKGSLREAHKGILGAYQGSSQEHRGVDHTDSLLQRRKGSLEGPKAPMARDLKAPFHILALRWDGARKARWGMPVAASETPWDQATGPGRGVRWRGERPRASGWTRMQCSGSCPMHSNTEIVPWPRPSHGPLSLGKAGDRTIAVQCPLHTRAREARRCRLPPPVSPCSDARDYPGSTKVSKWGHLGA